MRYVKIVLIALPALIVLGFLHYTLPTRDIVRIVDTENRRVHIGGVTAMFWNESEPSDATTDTRDIKFISAIKPNGHPMVFRNEDTGWGWPPYMKFDSASLQARAADLMSTQDSPRWVAVRNYGWRMEFLSIYPNALSVRAVDGPNVTLIPWTTIFVVLGLLILGFLVWRFFSRFFEKRIDPVAKDVAEAFDTANAKMEAQRAETRTGWHKFREWWVEKFH